MTLPPLRDDSLITDPGRCRGARSHCPWIRSLPLTSLQNPIVTIDGVPAEDVTVALGDRRVPPAELTEDDGWWFQQDRVTLAVPHELAPGVHDVAVEFGLRIPYLQVGPDGPLTLPFRAERSLVLDAPHALRRRRSTDDAAPACGRRLAARGLGAQRERLQLDARDDRGRPGCRRHRGRDRRGRPGGRDRSGAGTAVALVPRAERGGCRRLRRAPGTRRAGASASWARASTTGRRRAPAARTTSGSRSSCPQIEIAHQLGARGVRLPIGQAGRAAARARAADPARDRPHAVRGDPGFADARLAPGRRGDRPDRGHRRSARAPARGHLDVHARRSRELPRRACRRAVCRRNSSTRCGISGATPPPWARSSTCCARAGCRHPSTRCTWTCSSGSGDRRRP